MKRIFQKVKENINLTNFLILAVIIVISIAGIQVFKTEATISHLGGADNNLYLGGGAILGVNSPAYGLVVVGGNAGIGITNPSQKFHVSGNILSTGSHYLMDTNHSIRAISGVGVAIDTYGVVDPLVIHESSGLVSIKYGIYAEGSSYAVKGVDSGSGIYGMLGHNNGAYGFSFAGNGDIATSGNKWGACSWVITTNSCSDTWSLFCPNSPNARFMTGIENVGGRNSCIKKIYCCGL
jgi:hypothetical protein